MSTPEPSPSPPPPRTVPVWKWLLLLTPSVTLFILLTILSVIRKLFGSVAVEITIPMVILILPAGVVLCFECGDRLEKWRHGEIRNSYRAVGFGFLILIVNVITSIVVCRVAAVIFQMIFSK